MLQNFSIFKIIFNDAPQPWQLGFQDSAAPGFTGIVELHNTIFFYLVVISVGVFWVLGSIIYYYNSNKSPIVHKYLNHGFKAKGFKRSIRNYSTTSKINGQIFIIKEGSVKNGYSVELPWFETDAIQKSGKVMRDMLNYLAEIKTKLHHFLCNHSRLNELTSINP